MLFLTRIRFGVGLAEAAEANHVPWKEALIAWEYVRDRARTLSSGPEPGAPAGNAQPEQAVEAVTGPDG